MPLKAWMPPAAAPRILPEAISTGGDSAAVNTSLAMAVLPLRWGSLPRPQRRWGISFPPVPPVLTGDYQVARLRVCGDSSRVDDGSGEIDHGFEALVGFVGAHGDAFEFLELAEEVFDEMAPFVHLGVDLERHGAAGMPSNHDLGGALVEIGDDVVAVEGLVGDQRGEIDAVEKRRDTDGVEALSWQQHESDEIAERVGEGEDFCRHAAFGAADGLALSPPFAACPWRWTLTMVASIMAYSMSGSSETASKRRLKTSPLTQSRYRLKTLFHGPNSGGRSRHGLPVRAIHNTASTNRRLSSPLRPGSDFLPRQCASSFAHWASLRTYRSIPSLNHIPRKRGILNLNRP